MSNEELTYPIYWFIDKLEGIDLLKYKKIEIEILQIDFESIATKLTKSLEIIPALEAWIKSVKMFAHNEAERGRIPNGFKLVQKRATRKWIDDERAKAFFAFELGLDEDKFLKPRDLKSPAQVEAGLSKEDKKLIETLVVKQSSGNTLVPITDGREAIAPSVETEFKKLD